VDTRAVRSTEFTIAFGTVAATSRRKDSTVLQEPPSPSAAGAPRGTIAGTVIAGCGVLAVFAMAHHPSVEARTPAEAIREIGRIGAVNEVVHGAMIAIVAALLFAFAVYCLRRGIGKEAVLGGLVAHAIGTGATIVAATISGFLIPEIAARYATASPSNMQFAVQVISICGELIQLFGKLGVIGMSLAIVLWSVDLIPLPRYVRVTGALGLAVGLFAVAMLVFGGPLTPRTLGAIVLGQAIWYCAVGTLLIRRVL
jgi:hypothetical protein